MKALLESPAQIKVQSLNLLDLAEQIFIEPETFIRSLGYRFETRINSICWLTL